MIDCHCHLLFGIDDGPETIEESVDMAGALVRRGFSEVYCTPHCISGLYENTPTIVRDRIERLQQALDRAGIPLRLWPGMEYYLDSRFDEHLSDLQPLGTSRLLLVEAPSWAGSNIIIENVRRIIEIGYVPLFAHPERCNLILAGKLTDSFWGRARRLFDRKDKDLPSDLLSQLQSLGCLFQGNLGSFVGRYGRQAEKRAVALLEAGMYSCIGSDSHPRPGLEEMIAAGLSKVLRLTPDHHHLLSAKQLFF